MSHKNSSPQFANFDPAWHTHLSQDEEGEDRKESGYCPWKHGHFSSNLEEALPGLV